ncbi:MAG TPA: hypothetical protein VFU63_10440 [Ktedonobacterales bacterium]|nr:hypothetical protein [Ktedonobacterales bacterium]
MNDDQEPFTAAESASGPLPNRLTRGTLVGCLGLAGVLALPLMLFLSLEIWGLSRWAFLLIQLLAFGMFGGGIWLLARVPPALRERSDDPLHPLTARGTAPMLERPAGRQNRLGLAIVCTLLGLGMAGFVLAAFDIAWQAAVPVGMIGVSLVGLLLAVYGLCIALGRLEPPALRWVRTPATSYWLPQGGSVMLIGLSLTGWAMLIAAEAGLAWGAVGLVVLLLATVLIAPTFRRLPVRIRRWER